MYRYLRTLAMMLVGFLPAVGLHHGGVMAWAMPVMLALGLTSGWPALANSPAPHTARLVLAVTAATGIGLATWWDGPAAAATATLLAIGAGFTLAMVRELVRTGSRDHLIRSVTATTTGVAQTAICGLYLGAYPDWVGLARAGAIGIAAGGLAALVGLVLTRHRGAWLACTGLGVAIGGIGAWALSDWLGVSWSFALLLGGICALLPVMLTAWLEGPASSWSKRMSPRDAALIVLPTVLAAGPVWVAALIA